MSAKARGADFSSHQDDRHFEAALEQSLDFAFVKLTQGGDYTYQRAAARLERLRALGIVRGVYHYLTTVPPPAAQWRHFEDRLARLPHADELLVAVDYEHAGVTDAEARAFIAVGRRAGYRVGLYSSERTHAYRRLGQAWRWVAAWRQAPPPRRGWTFWQFAPGRDGSPDWDVFNGGRETLHRFQARHAGRWRWSVRFADGTLGPYLSQRRALLAALAHAIRHPRLRRYDIVRG